MHGIEMKVGRGSASAILTTHHNNGQRSTNVSFKVRRTQGPVKHYKTSIIALALMAAAEAACMAASAGRSIPDESHQLITSATADLD